MVIHFYLMKHGYGNLGAIPIPGTAEVRVQPGYRCMRTPGVPHFLQKKKFLGTGRVRARLKVAKNYVVFRQKLFDSQSLSLPSSLCRHSHILSLPATTHSELRFGLAATENQWGAPIWTCGFLLSLWLPFLFIGHLSLSLLGLKAEAPFSLCLPFQTQAAYFSLFTFYSQQFFKYVVMIYLSLSQPPTSKKVLDF
jgi:hypothetical protein